MSFLWNEVWWMQTIIASAISAASGIVIAIIGANLLIRKKLEAIDRMEKSIHEEHENFSHEHQSMLLSQEKLLGANQLSAQQSAANGTRLEKLNDHLLEKEVKQEEQYRLLTSSQQRMADAVQQGINGYGSIRQELLRLGEENHALRQQLAALQERYQELEASNEDLLSNPTFVP